MAPDPERIKAGWTYRFVAEGVRAGEMIRLYRGLGFDVAADPVRDTGSPEVCTVCYGAPTQRYRAIYTRRRCSARDQTMADGAQSYG